MIESMRFWRLTEELRLTDEQAVKVLPKVRALDESRRAYRRQRQGLMRGIDELLRSGSAGDRELRDSMYALDQADEQFRSQTRRIRRELNAMLTVEQQARLLVFEDHFEDEVRDLLSEFRQRNRGPRGSGEGATPP
jgi:Spy/CpxP family protein refolding chaperone